MKKKYYSSQQKDIHTAYNRCVTLNGKKMSRFTTLSQRSKSEMDDLVKSMAQICDSMIHETNDYLACQNIDRTALSTSNRLKSSIQQNQQIINIFNSQNDEEFMNLDIKRIKNKIKLFKNVEAKKRKNSKKKSSKKEQPSEKNVFSFLDLDNKKEEAKQNEIYLKKFKQISKLQKLKGEILMMEQKKKYAINKKYEQQKHYSQGFFFRKDSYYSKDKSIKVKSRYKNPKPSLLKYQYSPRQEDSKKPKKLILNSASSVKNKLPSNRISSANSYSTYYSMTRPLFSEKCTNNLSTKNSESSSIVNYFSSENRNTISNSLKKEFLDTSNRPFSATTYKSFSANNKKSKKKKLYLSKDTIQYIKDIHVKAYEENQNLLKTAERDSNFHSDDFHSKVKKRKRKEPSDIVDINKINKDLGFDPSDNKLKKFDETELLMKNADIVSKKLDDKCKVILRQVVEQMISEQKRLNKEYVMDSLYERKLSAINLKKEFQKVCDETIAIEKQLLTSNGIEPDDEKTKIFEMLFDIFEKKINSKEEISFLVRKCNVMKNIKPNLTNKKLRKFDTRKLCEQERFKSQFDTPLPKGHFHLNHHLHT